MTTSAASVVPLNARVPLVSASTNRAAVYANLLTSEGETLKQQKQQISSKSNSADTPASRAQALPGSGGEATTTNYYNGASNNSNQQMHKHIRGTTQAQAPPQPPQPPASASTATTTTTAPTTSQNSIRNETNCLGQNTSGNTSNRSHKRHNQQPPPSSAIRESNQNAYQLQYQEDFNKMRERLFRLLSKVPIQVETVSSAPDNTGPAAYSSSSPTSSNSSQRNQRRSTIEREPLVIKYYNDRSLEDILAQHFSCSLIRHNFERGLALDSHMATERLVGSHLTGAVQGQQHQQHYGCAPVLDSLQQTNPYHQQQLINDAVDNHQSAGFTVANNNKYQESHQQQYIEWPSTVAPGPDGLGWQVQAYSLETLKLTTTTTTTSTGTEVAQKCPQGNNQRRSSTARDHTRQASANGAKRQKMPSNSRQQEQQMAGLASSDVRQQTQRTISSPSNGLAGGPPLYQRQPEASYGSNQQPASSASLLGPAFESPPVSTLNHHQHYQQPHQHHPHQAHSNPQQQHSSEAQIYTSPTTYPQAGLESSCIQHHHQLHEHHPALDEREPLMLSFNPHSMEHHHGELAAIVLGQQHHHHHQVHQQQEQPGGGHQLIGGLGGYEFEHMNGHSLEAHLQQQQPPLQAQQHHLLAATGNSPTSYYQHPAAAQVPPPAYLQAMQPGDCGGHQMEGSWHLHCGHQGGLQVTSGQLEESRVLGMGQPTVDSADNQQQQQVHQQHQRMIDQQQTSGILSESYGNGGERSFYLSQEPSAAAAAAAAAYVVYSDCQPGAGRGNLELSVNMEPPFDQSNGGRLAHGAVE